MLKLKEFKNTLLCDEELALLRGGKNYYIGDNKVTRDEYKAHVYNVTGAASNY